jgi:putative nucleotidyltransferase with HDIG domain
MPIEEKKKLIENPRSPSVQNSASDVPWAQLRIPSFPQISIRILQLANNDTAPMRRLSDLISSDAGFSSEVLTLANSPLYARRTSVTTVNQAIALIGTEALKGLCLTVGVRAYLGKALKQESIRAVWRHSLACALIAEQIASAANTDKDSAYTAGILHDIGRLGLSVLHPQHYASLLQSHIGDSHSLLESERALFGFDHCEAGFNLVADWNLPPEFESVLSRHHSPPQDTGPWTMLDLIGLSCRMADATGFSVFPGCESPSYPELFQQLPPREQKSFYPDVHILAFDIANKINALETN